MQKMTPFLWFDGHIAEAMEFYRSVFPGSRVLDTSPGPDGSLMSATFELDGQRFIALQRRPASQAHACGVDVRELRNAGRGR